MVLGDFATTTETVTRPCIVTDLDGTLWPLDTPRDRVSPPREIIEEIRRVGRLVIATSKDCLFARQVIPGAEAYICVNGAEIIIDGLVCLDREVLDRRDAILRVFEAAKRLDAYIEEKRSVTGNLIGISIDWLGRPRPDLSHILTEARELGLSIYEPQGAHFVDIIASKRDKGFGVRLLRQTVCRDVPVVYIGDGENDVPGFMEADLRILVRHEYNTHLSVPGAIEVRRNELPEIIRRIRSELVPPGK